MTRDKQETFGTRVWRFVWVVGLVAAVIGGAVLAERISRLSQDALALGGGVLLGLVVGLVPAVMVFGGVWLIAQVYLERERTRRATQQALGPQVYVVPPMMGMPGYIPAQQQGALPEMQPVSREFRIIGE